MTDPETPIPLDALLAHRAWVRAVARALVTDENDADDVEQRTWLLALERPPRHAASLRGWLGAAARNVARKLGRTEARRARRESAAAPPPGVAKTAGDVAELVAEADLQQRIGRAVLALDEPFRATVLLRYFEALSVAEVAARLGVPEETVRSRLRRAHEKLRARLDEEDGPRRGAWAVAVLAWADCPLRVPPPLVPAATGAVAAGGAAAGGLAMSLGKTLAAAVVLVAVGATAWIAMRDAAGPPPAAPGSPPADAVAAGRPEQSGRAKRAKGLATDAKPADAAASAEELPPPVDLDRADRDLDLHGRVVTADDRPVAGARIASVTYPWRPLGVLNVRDRDVESAGPATRSALDGTFALRLARGDSVSLRIAADGFAPVELGSVLAGERLRIVMRPGVRLVVVLTGEDGAPLAGASVRLFNNPERGGSTIRARGTSGPDGVCAFEALPPEGWCWIAPEHPKGKGTWTKVDLPATGELRTEIRIPAGRTLTGTVTDAVTHAPVAGARVGMNWVLDLAVTTKDYGTFELPGWTGAGVNDVHVLAEGYAREAKVVGEATRLDFELTRGYAVSGRVVDPEARPVAGALVALIASDSSGGRQRTSDGYATTGPDGRFRVTSLRPLMDHALVVAAPGFARLRRPTPGVSADPDAASTELDLGDVTLAPPRRLEGTVVGADGAPECRVTVGVHPLSASGQPTTGYGASESRATDDLGRFRFAGLTPGRWSVIVRRPGAPDLAAEVEVPADRDVLDLRLQRAEVRRITVHVTDDSGIDLAGVTVSATDEQGRQVTGTTDAKGIVSLAIAASSRSTTISARIVEGARGPWLAVSRPLRTEEADIALVLARAAVLRGRLLDPDGRAVPNALLEAVGTDGTSFPGQSADDGRFRLDMPRTGRFRLVFAGLALRGDRYLDSGLAATVEDVAPGADLTVRCTRVASDRRLAVVVLRDSGEPCAGATVFLSGLEGPIATARTDGDGRVAFEGLPARELNLSAVLGESADRTVFAPATRSLVPAGQDVEMRCRRGVLVSGTLRHESGIAFRGFFALTALRGGVPIARIGKGGDSDGRFEILLPADDTTPVTLEVDIDDDRRADATLSDVRPGADDVRLVLPAPKNTK